VPGSFLETVKEKSLLRIEGIFCLV